MRTRKQGTAIGLAAAITLCVALQSVASAQNNSIMRSLSDRQGLTMAQASLIRPLPSEPRRFRVHDKVSVRVEELARVQAEGEMERRKNASYNAILNDWIRLKGLRTTEKTQEDGIDPQIQGQLQQLYRAESELDTSERLTLNVAVEIVDIRPNGHLVLEGQKEIHVNEELWLVSLSGTCRQEDIGPDNVVLSRDIMNLRIDKKERGHVRDGYRRGWLIRFIDQIHPF